VSIAAANAPSTTVLSGDPTVLRELVDSLTAEGLFCRLLESVDFASHSPQMRAPAAELRDLLAGLSTRPVAIPMVSTVTGQAVAGPELDPAYWAANLRQPVLFDGVVACLASGGHDTFVEISPHPMLADAVVQRLEAEQSTGVAVASLHRDVGARRAMLESLGQLYCAGYPVDWATLYGPPVPMVDLPTYPWQRQRYWLDDEYGRRRPTSAGHPLLETHVRSAAEPGASHWCARVDLAGFPYLRDHRVGGTPVMPAAMQLDAALAAARRMVPDGSVALEEVHLTRMAVVPGTAADPTLQAVFFPEAATAGAFRLFSRDGGESDWLPVASGRYRASEDADGATADLNGLRDRCSEPADVSALYASLARAGLEYGPAFQGIDRLWLGSGEALAQLRDLAALTADRDPYLIHPTTMDSCLQALAGAVGAIPDAEATTYVPVEIGRFTLAGGRAVPRYAYATMDQKRTGHDGTIGGRVDLFDDAGERIGTASGIVLRRLSPPGTDVVAGALLAVGWTQADEPAAPALPTTSPGWWLLLSDHSGVTDGLRSALLARGHGCVTVTPGPGLRRLGGADYEVDPTSPADLAAVLTGAGPDQDGPCLGAVHAWGLDVVLDGDEVPDEVHDHGSVSLLHLVNALVQASGTASPRLVVLTRGGQAVGDPVNPVNVAAAPLWGFTRTVAVEHGELRPTIVDLDPGRPASETSQLVPVLLGEAGEPELVLRDGHRHRPELSPWTVPDRPVATAAPRAFEAARDANFRLSARRRGFLDTVTATACPRTAPGPGQAEIEVAAAGLNFSDVLKALDLYPGLPAGEVALGAECAGRISAVGPGVTDLRVGDEVMAIAPAAFAAYVITDTWLVVRRPTTVDAQQAAGVPVAFLTAWHGLVELARLRAGEAVLVHSATGGVGLAALQIARLVGAHVYATAGTEEKRELLRNMGVDLAMDSRSLRFADEVLEATDGRGVDVVLNCLAGEALTRSLSVLAPGGRFVEIGKQDIYRNSHVGLELLKHNRSLFAVDMEHCFVEEPVGIAAEFAAIVRHLEDGRLSALPVQGFPVGSAPEAFTLMARAGHIGKVVLSMHPAPPVATPVAGATVTDDATYLITGGLGGLGLRVAEYLVRQGGRHLALLGRGAPSAQAEGTLLRLRQAGADVTVLTGDVSRAEDVAAALATIDRDLPPLRGVIHAAGVLDDSLLSGLDRDRMLTVAASKVAGGWHLHRATRHRDLAFFVLFSSAAALLGSPGQASYCAANAFLDALAHHRRASGLPALSISWGPWSEVGLAARSEHDRDLSGRGVLALRPEDGIEALHRLLPTGAVHVAVLPVDRDRLRDAVATGLMPHLLARLAGPATDAGAVAAQRSGEVRQRMLAVEPGRRRRDVLVQHCRNEIATILTLDIAQVDPAMPLANMGFDSLLSLELKKRLESSLSVILPATLAWRLPTIDAMVPFLADQMAIQLLPAADQTPTPAASRTATPASATPEESDQESTVDIESRLLEKIRSFEEGHGA
jgi:polyketide synthase 12